MNVRKAARELVEGYDRGDPKVRERVNREFFDLELGGLPFNGALHIVAKDMGFRDWKAFLDAHQGHVP